MRQAIFEILANARKGAAEGVTRAREALPKLTAEQKELIEPIPGLLFVTWATSIYADLFWNCAKGTGDEAYFVQLCADLKEYYGEDAFILAL